MGNVQHGLKWINPPHDISVSSECASALYHLVEFRYVVKSCEQDVGTPDLHHFVLTCTTLSCYPRRFFSHVLITFKIATGNSRVLANTNIHIFCTHDAEELMNADSDHQRKTLKLFSL